MVCTLVALVGACTSEPTSPDSPRHPSPPHVRLSFIQQRLDEGTSRGNLRVISHDPRALTVSRVGVDWPGYGDPVVEHMDGTIEPRQTLDLRVVMPPPTCDAPPAPAYGVVVLAGITVRARIDHDGQGFLTRMWQRACDERAFGEAVSVTYEGPWRTVRAFGYDALQGRVVMRRRSGDPTVTLGELTARCSSSCTSRTPWSSRRVNARPRHPSCSSRGGATRTALPEPADLRVPGDGAHRRWTADAGVRRAGPSCPRGGQHHVAQSLRVIRPVRPCAACDARAGRGRARPPRARGAGARARNTRTGRSRSLAPDPAVSAPVVS